MKKWCALMLAVMMLMTAGVSFAEENEFKTIPSTLTKLVDDTVSGWYSTATNRALLTVLLILDIMSQDSTVEFDINMPSYVQKVGTSALVAHIATKDGDYLCAWYEPSKPDNIEVMESGLTSSLAVEMVLENMEYKFEENTDYALETVVDELGEIFGD